MARIERVTTRHIAIPFDRPLTTGLHVYESLQNVLVTIEAEGLTGIGYAFNFAPKQAAAVRALVEDLGELLVGKDVSDVRRHWSDMWTRIDFVGRSGPPVMALSALDTALWDLFARECGQPLHRLLGTVRDVVEIYPTGGFLTDPIESIVEQVLNFKTAGYRRCKVKVGRPEWRIDVARVGRLVEAAGDDFGIMVDANQAWSLKTALNAGLAFQELGVSWFEEPIPAHDYSGYSVLTGRLEMTVAAGESLFGTAGHWPLIDLGGCDVLMLNLMRCGGPTEFMQIGAMARARHIAVSAHTFTEIAVHLAAALPHATFCEYLPGWWDGLFQEKAIICEGKFHLSDRPGLGLTFADETIKRYSVD